AGAGSAHGGNLRGARHLRADPAQRVRGAFGHEPDQLPSPPSDVAGVSHLVARRPRGGKRLGGRAALWLPPPRPFRSRLSCPLRRVAVRHLAAELASGNSPSRAAQPAATCETLVKF